MRIPTKAFCCGLWVPPNHHHRPTTMWMSESLNCDLFDVCSGCAVDRDFRSTATATKAKALLEPLLKKELKIHCGPARRWRTQARLVASPPKTEKKTTKSWIAGAELGLYAGGSHDVVRIVPECQVHAVVINTAAEMIEDACRKTGIRGVDPLFDDDGQLRYVQLSVERTTEKVALTLVWNSISPKDSAQSVTRLVNELWGKRKDHPFWHSIWINYRGTGKGNAIFSYDPRRWKILRGREYIIERPFRRRQHHPQDDFDDDLPVYFSPQVFRQANLDAFGDLVHRLGDFVPADSVVCELYAGVGAIGLALRPRLAELRASDENERCDGAFALSMRDQDRRYPDIGPATFLPLKAEEAMDYDGPGADVLIVDPPRKGLDPLVLESLLSKDSEASLHSIERLCYVSCGFDALQRDLAALLEKDSSSRNPRWSLVHAEGFVFFPGSDHIETLVILDRFKAAGGGGGGGGGKKKKKKKKRQPLSGPLDDGAWQGYLMD